MTELSIEQLSAYGISQKHEIMDNGELRARLIGADGSSYIRTEASCGGWQASHHHSVIYEMYIIQSGFAYFVSWQNGKPVLTKHLPGDYFVSQPLVPHNMYLSAGAVTHTVKFGDCTKADWIADPFLDELIQKMNPSNIL